MPFNNYLARKLLDHMIGKTEFRMPTGSLYLALATSSPTVTSTGSSFNEITTYVNYARKAITGSMFDAADTNRQLINSQKISFIVPGIGSSGTYSYIVLLDAASSGNIFAYEAITSAPISCSANNVPTFPIGSLIFDLD